LVEEDSGCFHLEAMPPDFLKLNQCHMGLYFAEKVQKIVEKFGLKDKVRTPLSFTLNIFLEL
jgi:hypothetical protein